MTKQKPWCEIKRGDLPRYYRKWFAMMVKKNPLIRSGVKTIVNTKTYKTYFVHTIEMWCKARRQYLPLLMPDGGWKWKNHKTRDAVLSDMKGAMNAN